jgi:protein involved in polysaccharide export with SLBB domain
MDTMTSTPSQGLPRRGGQSAALAGCLLALCVSLAGCHQHQMIPAAAITNEIEPPRVSDGPSIVVDKSKPRFVSVTGFVHKPDQFQIKPGEEWRLIDAMAAAGGVKREGFVDTVYVMRQLNTMQAPVVIKCSYKAARSGRADNLLLADSDLVHVDENRVIAAIELVKGLFSIPFPFF